MSTHLLRDFEECVRQLAEHRRHASCLPLHAAIARVEGEGGTIFNEPFRESLCGQDFWPQFVVCVADSPYALGFYASGKDAYGRGLDAERRLASIVDEAARLLLQLPEVVVRRLALADRSNWYRAVFHLAWHFRRPFLSAARHRLLRDASGHPETWGEELLQYFRARPGPDIHTGLIFSRLDHQPCARQVAGVAGHAGK